jgi:K+-transporting ATPase ATPase C chain
MNPLLESNLNPPSVAMNADAPTLFHEVRRALGTLLILGILCCGVYPMTVWGILQGFFPDAANGSLVLDTRGVAKGSLLLGQSFRSRGYFHPRPSAAGTVGYDGVNSSGSNLGPTSSHLSRRIRERVAAYRELNGLDASTSVPADAVMASGSGLDPLISPRNAAFQAPRIARERGIPESAVRDLIRQHEESRQWWIFGEPGVSVLRLNRALDALVR